MDAKKEKLLQDTHQIVWDVSMRGTLPTSALDGILADDVMGFGTTFDEKIFSVQDCYELVARQKEQSSGMEIVWDFHNLKQRLTSKESSAYFAEDISVTVTTGLEVIKMYVRLTAVYEYIDNKWVLIHFHGSKPENTASATDTFGVEEWKSRNAELEKIVAEKTAELLVRNHELEIDAALERVRAATMAMMHTEELLKVIRVVREQLEGLRIEFDSTNFRINEQEKDWDLWIDAKWMDAPKQWYIPFIDHPFFHTSSVDRQVDTHIFTKEDKDSFDAYLFKLGLIDEPKEESAVARHEKFFKEAKGFAWSSARVKNVTINIANSQAKPYSIEENRVLMSFTIAFEQAYTRFLDLQKAEAQAREAKIEAALETVRASSMAMQHSEELEKVVKTLSDKLIYLGLSLDGAFIFFFEKEKRNLHLWIATNHLPAPIKVDIPYSEDIHNNPFIKDLWQAIETGGDFINQSYSGKLKDDYFRFVAKHNESEIPEAIRKFQLEAESWMISFSAGKNSVVGVDSWSGEYITQEDFQVLKRFAKVFEQAYTRFLDLQKAEAQTKEAQIELGLERVRAKAMAMQSSSELAGLVNTLFKELTKLDILLDRCIIMLYDAKTNDSTWWIAAPETDALPISVFVKYHEYPPYLAYMDAWHKRIVKWRYILEGKTKKEWDNFIFSETEMVLLPTAVKEGMKSFKKIFLNVSFNNFGSLTASSGEPLPDEQFEILLRFAKVFDSTYTRFNDLQKSEALATEAKKHLIQIEKEKIRAETALQELQSAQTQLIQSEKMASLGVLTAGIAHEIQNPLNFVNNFSEVNRELIGEMKAELEKGNLEEVKELANDIEANEEKISHHGKRADSIVKGMLQHSRSSSRVKELTDINALADEYLRLAYHGLRAKDKSFSAHIETDLDLGIGKINIVPQDMGRVIMNLVTNAFYAVNERKAESLKQNAEGGKYEPKVSIITKKEGNRVLISVIDNGNGIPASVKEKIFQPFFTTKPTGKGTGLGLSLSYDIVKAHNGSLNVETNANEGTTFTILLTV